MSINRISTSRFAFPQTSAEWEQLVARAMVLLAKVPLSRWQFLVQLFLILSLSFSVARLFWLLLPIPSIPPATVALVVVNPVASNGSSVNVEQLKSLSVFGKANAPVASTEVPNPENQATVSNLNLMLMGIIASNDDSLARAIITAGDKTDVYAIGNSLPVGNGVSLTKIMSDRVIVNNNGQFESLMLYQDNPNATPISQAYVPTAAAATGPGRPWQADNSNPSGSSPPGYESPERAAATNPVAGEVSRNLSDVVAMSIHREGGQVVGYKIRPGRDAEKFKTLGLQTDDIVTAVNGMPLTNPAKIMEVYKNMGNTTSASLEIKRGGSVMTVDVVLQ